MKSIGELIRDLRKERGLTLQDVSKLSDIDKAILSKIERGQRKVSKKQVIELARVFDYDEEEMLVAYFSDRIISEVENEELAKEALEVAEAKIGYIKFTKTDKKEILNKIISILQNFPSIKKAWVYGSFSRGDDNFNSDIDIAVNAGPGFSYFDLAEVQFRLEKVVQRRVDIGFIDSFKSHIYKNIEPDLKCIYERQVQG